MTADAHSLCIVKHGRRLGGLRRAFTLVEAILALAIFATAAVVIGQVCYNCIYPLDIEDKNALEEAVIDQAVQTILAVTDYDSLEDTNDLEGVDGEKYRVTAKATPTEVLDLFLLEVSITGGKLKGEHVEQMLVVRPAAWYETSNARDNLLSDRTRDLDNLRQKWKAEK